MVPAPPVECGCGALPVWLADNRSIQINGFEQFEFINNDDQNPAVRLVRADATTQARESANAVL